jgi:hypothetical protein
MSTKLTRRSLTLCISGAVNGLTSYHKSRASRPPLHRVVRPRIGLVAQLTTERSEW